MNLPSLTPRTLILIGAFAASFQVVATAPASLIPALAGFSRAGLRYEEARGSVWNGTLRGVDAMGLRLGDVEYEIAPFSLFAGHAGGVFFMSGGALEGDGRARIGPFGGVEISNARLLFDLGAATRYAFLGEPLAGSLRADVVRLVLSKKGCVESQARLLTDVLAAPARRLKARAFDLAGSGSCDNGDFLVELSGKGEEGAVAVSIRISPSMAYWLAATVVPVREDVAAALQTLGFRNKDGELTIGAEGVIGSHRS